jgi:16S rRNA (uracil1498-N3)-methyltransferase
LFARESYNAGMRRRFFADEVHGDVALLKGQNAQHLARVLRAKVGQEYEIAGDGRVRLGRITALEDVRVEFALGEEITGRELIPITLVVAVFKFDRMEWAIEKATELGVTRIVPVIARRTESHLAQAAVKRAERWRRISHEASQQSRRVSPPEISDPVKLKDAVAMEAELKILCAESEDKLLLRDAITSTSNRSSIALAVGPEGGWAEEESRVFESASWTSASLGPTILRAETAVIAACSVTAALLFPD